MNTAKFWIVWGPQHGNPKVRHTSPEDAHKEADRLASQFDGPFIVIESVGEYRKPPKSIYVQHGKQATDQCDCGCLSCAKCYPEAT